MFRVKHFCPIGQKPYKASDRGPFQSCKIDQFYGAIPDGRRRRLDGLAGMREIIPYVKFARRIEAVTRDAAAAWSRQSQAIPRP